MKKTPPDPRQAAKRQALRALAKARRIAARTGVAFSEWEGEFLGSVEDRVKAFGRAFGDPEKGDRGMALSTLQSVKLKEIVVKAKGEKKPMTRSAWRKSPQRRDAGPED